MWPLGHTSLPFYDRYRDFGFLIFAFISYDNQPVFLLSLQSSSSTTTVTNNNNNCPYHSNADQEQGTGSFTTECYVRLFPSVEFRFDYFAIEPSHELKANVVVSYPWNQMPLIAPNISLVRREVARLLILLKEFLAAKLFSLFHSHRVTRTAQLYSILALVFLKSVRKVG